MSATPLASSQPKWRTYTAWTLQILAAFVFAAAGGAKLAGVERMVGVFAEIGVGQWFRYVTGALEVAGAALLLTSLTAFWGASLLACVMVGAVITHLAFIGGSPAPAIVLLCITTTIAGLRFPRR